MRINNFIEIEFSIQRPVPCHGAFFLCARPGRSIVSMIPKFFFSGDTLLLLIKKCIDFSLVNNILRLL
ncbi:MAG: hypothetical protein H6Q21_1015 [Bacteroidetes bacterium]|nr:hypothetical protein [Bacteroidota bacterium]